MKIEIKKSIKPIHYNSAMKILEKKMAKKKKDKSIDFIWALEHPDTYTAGISTKDSEILDKSIDLIKTNRGGKITFHGPGQKIFYFIIDLNKRKRDIRNFIKIIEKTIIQTLDEYGIKSFSDRKNIGIWVVHKKKIKKVAAIGLKIKNWIAYHGFALNIENSLTPYKKIIPCGIKNREVTNLKIIKNQDYNKITEKIIKNFKLNLKN